MSEAWIEYQSLKSIAPADRNPREHDLGALHQSLERFGYTSPVIINEQTGKLVAGHGRVQALVQAKASGQEPPQLIKVIGGEWHLPVIRGVSFANDREAEAYLIADNRLTELATWDDAALAELLEGIHEEHGTLAGTGYDGDDLDDLLGNLKHEEEKYTRKIQPPIYEPQEAVPPAVQTLMERDKAEELKTEINSTPDLPDDVRTFLLAAAERHTRFRFDRIAEYYAHAPAHIQQLMESSALVIIDFDQAIEKGYVKMTEEIMSYVQTE